jgi:mannose-6-phosphate isomerase-like protein (cupin superfamily)
MKKMAADQKSLEHRLHEEGFLHTYVWQDGPDAFYPDHTHAVETAHIILDGEMTLARGRVTRTFGVGERFDVPANAVHSAKMGPHGCKYLIGEK